MKNINSSVNSNVKPLPNVVQVVDYHHRESTSSSHFYDFIGNESFFESEPTIIDAIKYVVRKCFCCCTCKCFYNDITLNLNSNTWDYSIEDEVEKAMKQRQQNKIYELQKSFLENSASSKENSDNISLQLSEHSSKDNYKHGARMRCYCIPCLTYKPKICQLNIVSLLIQFLCILIMGCVELIQDKQQHYEIRVSLGTLIGIMCFFQLTIMIQLILICIKKLWQLTFFEIMQLYITSIVIFTGVYATAHFYDNDNKKLLGAFEAFNLKNTEFRNSNFAERIVAFFYFSCSQQTLCGVSEIIPKTPPTQILAAVQMLFGVFFSIIIISIGISRVGQELEKRHEIDDEVSVILRETCWHSFTHNKKIITLRRTIRKYLFLFVVVIQVSKNVVEWVTTDTSFADKYNILHSVIYIIFDVLNICVVLMTSLKFLHIGHMTELKLSFLCQTYLSTMLIFTGVYVDLQVSGNGYNDGAFITGEDTYVGMWATFLYFSFAMMTLCGSGLNVKPKTSYATLSVCVEMLIGLFFHVYIFGTGLLLLANKKFRMNKKEKEKERERREFMHIDVENNNTDQVDASELIMLTLLQE